ncbi:MAG: hypothetical protein IH969_04355 [Candidatus Krumholzibacteriota bacterium]|nr:hypothetical protein [Candidatus Krumholzibacteriota bacterium]
MRRLVLHMACALALASSVPSFAQDGGTEGVFTLGAGSRAIGLGGSVVGAVDDASALYWNPAALPHVPRPEFAAMYMPLFGDFTGADYVFAGLVYPTLEKGAFGVGFLRVGTTFDGFDELSRPTGEGSYSESQFFISYGIERHVGWLLGLTAIGASVKVSRIKVDPFASTAPGGDLGLRWVPDAMPSVSVGINIQDIVGANHKLDVASDKTYRTVLAGVGYTRSFANGSALNIVAQADFPERAGTRAHFGAEYEFSRYLALQTGFDDGEFTFGLGVTVSNFGFDYAMLSRGEAGTSYPVTFSARFGTSIEDQAADVEAERVRAEEEVIRRNYEDRAAGHREQARLHEFESEWASALDEWKIVLEYMPDDEEAARAAAVARERVIAEQVASVRDAGNEAIVRSRFAQGLDSFNEGDWVRARADWLAILAIDSMHVGAIDYNARTREKIDTAMAAHRERARSLESQQRLTEAIAEWNNVQQYDPQNRAAQENITRLAALIETTGRDLAQAQRDLRIVRLYEDALRYYNSSEYNAVIRNIDELLRMKSDHEDARKLRALALRKLTPLSAQEKQRIRQLYLSGMQYFSRDEYRKAVTEWKKILEIDPSNVSVQKNIDEARERLRQLGERE